MNNKIILKDGKEIIGVSNIVISEIDDKIYVNNISKIEDSIKGSFAVYYQDSSPSLTGSGNNCKWNDETSTLEVTHIQSTTLLTEYLTADFMKVATLETSNYISKKISCENAVVSDFLESEKICVDRWIGFKSNITPNTHPFKVSIGINPKDNKEVLLFKSKDYTDDVRPTTLMAFTEDRVCLREGVNLVSRHISSPLGTENDIAGDIAIDENFIYYCIKDFDGTSKIWKRCSLLEW